MSPGLHPRTCDSLKWLNAGGAAVLCDGSQSAQPYLEVEGCGGALALFFVDPTDLLPCLFVFFVFVCPLTVGRGEVGGLF